MTIEWMTYIEQLGTGGSLMLSVFILLCLVFRLRETPNRRMHLWAMMAFFGLTVLDALDSLFYNDVFNGPPALAYWPYFLLPGFVISLYFFVRGLTSSDPKLTRRDWVHIIPFVLTLICMSPMLMQPGRVRLELDPFPTPEAEVFVVLGLLGFWLVWLISLITYGTLCVRRLVRHKRNIRKLFSDLEGKRLRWLDALTTLIILLIGFVALTDALAITDLPDLRAGWASVGFDVVLNMSMGLFALRASPPLPTWSAEIVKAETKAADTHTQTDGRYARSGLGQGDLDRYAKRLERRMSEGQLWRNHTLNLRTLASEIRIPAIHLSEVLNTKLSLSFYDYVNQLRVHDACDLLSTSDKTILEISEMVGFNAKSTFNTSFKKVTEQTPSEWRAAQKPD